MTSRVGSGLLPNDDVRIEGLVDGDDLAMAVGETDDTRVVIAIDEAFIGPVRLMSGP